MTKFCILTIGCEKSQNFPIFIELITYLHMYDMYLEKLTLDISVVQQPSRKKVRVFLISGEIIMNLSNQLKKKISNFTDLLKIIMNLCDQS